MGRIRTVKPELFTHAELFDAEKEVNLPVRLAFIGLFTCCDREGRFKWRPRELKLACLPHDELDFSRVLDALVTRGFVVKYGDYGCIPTFSKHQVINNRERPSEIDPPTETDFVTRGPRVTDASPTREARGESGREGKGREQEGKGKELEHERKTLFANSRFIDIEVVKASLPELVNEGVNLDHYRDAIRNWSDTKDEKRSDRGWLATFRQWTKTDRDKGELKKIAAARPAWNPRA